MKYKAIIIVIGLSLFGNVTFTSSAQAAELQDEKLLEVHFINVGQGDSILVRTPSGKNILIDGGRPSAGDKVVNYLKEQKIRSLDIVVSTHPDYDHVGGLVAVLKKFKVEQILDSGKWYYTKAYLRYIRQVKRKDIPVTIAKTDMVKELDDEISLKVLNSYTLLEGNNEGSLAFSLTYNTIDFMLMGDIERAQELKLVEKYNLNAEILKVAHHGSDTSSSWGFLQEVSPEQAIISYSKDNDFGHPVKATIDKLLSAGANIYSTAKAGDIVIKTDGISYDIEVSGTGQIVQKSIS
ncbi:ComEC/Rec2 family competence protein [Aquibacillus kalidii]|uniref:ComEC/Rec2 family competence protein n=1 Tax=Aquibacillus kalidii TaxID=2762597 RepID=UPI001648AB46|nr:MBL fold metallo-hydrolase [Aquibacillus kalidii]